MMRWISGLLLALVVVLLLRSASQKLIQGVVVGLSLLGLWEYFSLTLKDSGAPIKVIGTVVGGLSCATLVFLAQDKNVIYLLFSTVILLTFILYFKGKSDASLRIRDMAFFYFGIMTLSVLFSFWAQIRALDRWPFWVFLLLGSTFFSDTGAYLVGRQFGRHPLAPLLSPKKTVEGLLGGWAFSMIAALTVRWIFWSDYPLLKLTVIASLIATVGPLGDLSESLIKRGVNAKDSGNLIPGHGGFLDRVDALLFTGPVVYFFAQYFS